MTSGATSSEPAQRWLDTEQLSELLGGIKPATIRAWRLVDRGPPFVKLGGIVRYDRAAVELWLAAGGDRRPAVTPQPRRRRRIVGTPAPGAVAGRPAAPTTHRRSH